MALKSLLNRKFTVALTIFSIAISITLLLGVERIRIGLENSFTNSISGTDLIVGARSGDEQLLLSTVFHIGMATSNISWHSYEDIAANELIDWTIPISLGDSHEGFGVIGTNHDYFTHYQFANKQHLQFQDGKAFQKTFDAVLGADVAALHNYKIGDEIVINHGSGKIAFHDHGDKPFRVTGILKRTGTPVDQTIHVSLEGIEAIHIDWVNGMPDKHMHFSADEVEELNLEPEYITAFLVGLKNRTNILAVQRQINTNKSEPLTAVMPGLTLQRLWNMMGKIESALLIVSGFVAVAGLIGMLVALLTGVNERRREMAILRSVGASPLKIFGLISCESIVITVWGIALGIAVVFLLLQIAKPILETQYGIYLNPSGISLQEIYIIGTVIILGILIGIIPGYKIYKYSLLDGMTVKM
ncbi:ABC transporter permease [Lutibacter sp. HS1-25]|uniref:ABC transporter permease n=1 Tax=Lutibacter sp. HS1-25 TaxID=2485000 RepID=UPI00197C917A|nr:ABC transporter permease [Lutibacter sp. HS1-25]